MDHTEFLEILNSEAFETERKQVLLRIERILIPTLNENSKNEVKVKDIMNFERNFINLKDCEQNFGKKK